MYSVSDNFIAAIKKSDRDITTRVTVDLAEYTGESIIDFTVEGDMSADGQLTIGSTVCQSLELNMLNNITVAGNSVIKPYVSINTGSQYEEIPLGKYNISGINKKKSVKKITAFDNMIKFEQNFATTSKYPQTITQILTEMCTKVGITLASALPPITIPKKITNITMRQMISIIASLCGGIARVNRLGNLEIINISTVPLFAITTDNYFTLDVSEESFTVKKITAVKDNGSTISSGTGNASQELTFGNNYITQAQLNTALTKVLNLNYYSGNIDMQGMPMLDMGDLIAITDTNDKTYNILLMHQKLIFNGGLRHNITSSTKSENDTSYNTVGNTTATVQKTVQRVDVIEADLIKAKRAIITQADIADLTVNHLQTLPSDAIENEEPFLNYIESEGQYLSWITATKNTTKPQIQLTDAEGNNLYWTDADHTEKTTDETDYKVMVYQYDYLTKLKIYFDTSDANAFPIMEWGAGDTNGYNKGTMKKTDDGFYFKYLAADGVERGISLLNGSVQIDGVTNFSSGINLSSSATKIDNVLAFSPIKAMNLLKDTAGTDVVGVKHIYDDAGSIYESTVFQFDSNGFITGYKTIDQSGTVSTVNYGSETAPTI